MNASVGASLTNELKPEVKEVVVPKDNTVIKIGRKVETSVVNERNETFRKITIIYKPGERPFVEFDGFWSGRLLQSAISSISKAYRLRRYEMTRSVREGGAK